MLIQRFSHTAFLDLHSFAGCDTIHIQEVYRWSKWRIILWTGYMGLIVVHKYTKKNTLLKGYLHIAFITLSWPEHEYFIKQSWKIYEKLMSKLLRWHLRFSVTFCESEKRVEACLCHVWKNITHIHIRMRTFFVLHNSVCLFCDLCEATVWNCALLRKPVPVNETHHIQTCDQLPLNSQELKV